MWSSILTSWAPFCLAWNQTHRQAIAPCSIPSWWAGKLTLVIAVAVSAKVFVSDLKLHVLHLHPWETGRETYQLPGQVKSLSSREKPEAEQEEEGKVVLGQEMIKEQTLHGIEMIQMKGLFFAPTTLASFLSLQSFLFCPSQNHNSFSLRGVGWGSKRGGAGSLWLPLEVRVCQQQ